MILKAGGIEPIIALLNGAKNKSIIKIGTWALSNCCRGKPLPDFEHVYKAVPVLCQVLIKETQYEIITDAAWAMSYLSDGGNECIKMILDTGLVNGLLRFLKLDT